MNFILMTFIFFEQNCLQKCIKKLYVLPKRTSYYIFKGGDFMKQMQYN